jgi:uncharacterized protein YdhG (YjbR/CyaY superfamily)
MRYRARIHSLSLTFANRMDKNTFTDVDAYIESFPEATRKTLHQMRETIKSSAPGAQEGFSYGMPAYKYRGKPLVYFAAFKHHIGLYATPNGHEAFKEALAPYKGGKGSVQFPLDHPLPIKLIRDIVTFRVTESDAKNNKRQKTNLN